MLPLCLFSSNGLAQNSSGDTHADSRNIYVDYGLTPASYPMQKAATNGLGCWIWSKDVLDKQTVHLWQTFKIPGFAPATNAELRISADNAFRVWLDGHEIGSGSDWRTLSIYELSGKLNPGTHVLAVEGFNDCDKAGVIAGLAVKLANGKELHFQSDPTWRVVPLSVSDWQTITRPSHNWPTARYIAKLGQVPWWSVPKTIAHIQESLPDPLPLWRTRDFQFALFAGCGVFIAIGLGLLLQLLIQSRTHKFLQVERDRIARDIHDDLGSKITQWLLTGEASQIRHNGAFQDNTSAEPILQMCDGARNILSTIDEIVWIVNSQHNTLNDFAIHVCKYTERFLESSAIRFRFDMEYELPAKTLSQLARRNLLLAVKEALNNAVKYSHATELTVRMTLNGSKFIVIVEDNGIGFDYQQADPARNGLTNMMSRMEEIGGDFQVISRPGEGCKVCLGFPLKQSRFRHFFFKPPPQRPDAGRPHKDDSGPAAEHMTVTNKD